MEPTSVFVLLAPFGAASVVSNLLVFCVALTEAFDASPRICTNNRVFHNVLTANQALASLLLGAAHVGATLHPLGPFGVVVEAVTLSAALSVALIAVTRAFSISQHSLTPTLASTQRRNAGAASLTAWLSAAGVTAAPLPSDWRPVIVALMQFAVPAVALLAAQLIIASRLRKRRLAKTNALLSVSIVHFILGFAVPTVAPLAPLSHALCVLDAVLSPVVYGWLCKPLRNRLRRIVNAPCVLFGKRRKEERRLRMMAGADRRMHVYIVAVPLGIYV
ncbi:Hypothetical predicted protein [Cloeon dipterum]|uniref:Uncharacterized protein n=1 Tax=Cloeon dipterum TaxID=197152 RepID=A0A8S1CXH3_9INSE|nr:Hypothetical predicted protein [Cloeon dipterum]